MTASVISVLHQNAFSRTNFSISGWGVKTQKILPHRIGRWKHSLCVNVKWDSLWCFVICVMVHQSAFQQIQNIYIAVCSKEKRCIICHFKSDPVRFKRLIAFMSAHRINIIVNQTHRIQHMVINYQHRSRRWSINSSSVI